MKGMEKETTTQVLVRITIKLKNGVIGPLSDFDNKVVYDLSHAYEYGIDFEDDIRLIGIYSSKQAAEDSLERHFCLKGFNEHSRDCFVIDKYVVDKDACWLDGFVSCGEFFET
ncbi:hypothetical protein AGMMS49975_21940 [Clostridia bacterium]|nr:hypothetical protein AGMMS49975_21940 [Clostridia bacterium]